MADSKPVNECTNPLIDITGGSFQLGSPEGVGYSDEHPARNANMSSFQIHQHEVSLDEIRRLNETSGRLTAVLSGCKGTAPNTFSLFANAGESQAALQKRARQIAGQLQCDSDIPIQRRPKIEIPTVDSFGNRINDRGDEYPVQGLKWEEAMLYCQSIGATLPTGAQIEYVSDTGGATPNAVTYENSGDTTAPVCGPKAEARNNRYDVRDIEGNLWELTADQYDSEYYSGVNDGAKDPSNPLTKPKEQRPEVRGGSFLLNAGYARAAGRYNDNPGYRNYFDGFRCAR